MRDSKENSLLFRVRGYPNFYTKIKKVFLQKNKCSVKFLPQMVLQTENSNFTYFVLLSMLLMAPISGPIVKIIRFSKDPTIAQIMLNLFKANYFQTEQRCDTSQNRHILNACCLLHRNSTVARRVTNVTSEHYGDP